MRKPTLAAIAAATIALAITGPAAADAAVHFLPTVKRTVSVSGKTTRWCDHRAAGRGIAAATYRAPMTGYVSARLAGPRHTNWDLAAFDASGNRRAASLSFGSRELVQTWVTSGERLTIQACRRSGAARTNTISISFADVKPPKASGKPQLLSVAVDSRADLDRLDALGVDVTHSIHRGRAQVIVANAAQRHLLERRGFSFRTKIADLQKDYMRARMKDMAYAAQVDGRSPLPSGRTTYRIYSDYQKELGDLAKNYPSIVKPMQLPKPSFQGRPLQGVEISKNVNDAPEDGRPVFLLVGEHHAREWPSAEAAMEFATMLAQGYGHNDRITQLLTRERIVVVPIINPDGFISSRSWPVDPADRLGGGGRGNPVDPDSDNPGLGVDPDWADPCKGSPKPPLDDDQCAAVQTCLLVGSDDGVNCNAAGDLYLAEGIAPPGGLFSYRRKNCDGAVHNPNVPCELQHGVDPNRNYGQYWGGPGSDEDRTSQAYRGEGPWSEPETQAVHEYSQQRQITGLITLHNVAALVLRPPGLHNGGLAPDEERMKQIGDAMAAATGYTSEYGYQLYDTAGTTEDWNYAAAGTYGYTIEIGPEGGDFHMPYKTGVIDQWTGDYRPATSGKGLREALLIAAEAAANPGDHSVLTGTARAGSVLHVHKDFETPTYGEPFCKERAPGFGFLVATSDKGCLQMQDPFTVPDFLDSTMVVPPSGKFTWHMNPSTRPFVGKDQQVAGDPVTTFHEEHDGDGSGAPAVSPVTSEHTFPFSITDADTSHLALALTFDNPAEDYDLALCKKEASGACKPFGNGDTNTGSSGNINGEAEHITADGSGLNGDYVATVTDYASATDSWHLAIDATKPGSVTTVPGHKEAWTLTCETPSGQVLESRQLFIDRGQTITTEFAGACAKQGSGKKPPRK